MNSLKELYENVFRGDRRIKLLIAAGLAAVMIILLTELVPSSPKVDVTRETDYTEYTAMLVSDTESLISSIDGAGRCKVMITLKNSNESVFAKNTEQSASSGSNSLKNEYVLYDGQDGEQPVRIKEYFPDVQGVAVVCDGADNTAVREAVINSVAALYNLPVTKISVSKYKR